MKKKYTLQENLPLTTNFSEKILLVIIITNLDTNLRNKKLLVLLFHCWVKDHIFLHINSN